VLNNAGCFSVRIWRFLSIGGRPSQRFASESKRDSSNARLIYEQLLHHDPGNIDLEAKIKELTEER
jgi:hypothetical protein